MRLMKIYIISFVVLFRLNIRKISIVNSFYNGKSININIKVAPCVKLE